MANVKKQNGSSAEHSKLCAILAYIFPIGLIWYLVDENLKKDSFVAFHVHQSLALAIAAIAVQIALAILTLLFFFIGLGFIFGIISWIVQIGILVLFILGIVYAAQEEQKELPVIGKFAKFFKF